MIEEYASIPILLQDVTHHRFYAVPATKLTVRHFESVGQHSDIEGRQFDKEVGAAEPTPEARNGLAGGAE